MREEIVSTSSRINKALRICFSEQEFLAVIWLWQPSILIPQFKQLPFYQALLHVYALSHSLSMAYFRPREFSRTKLWLNLPNSDPLCSFISRNHLDHGNCQREFRWRSLGPWLPLVPQVSSPAFVLHSSPKDVLRTPQASVCASLAKNLHQLSICIMCFQAWHQKRNLQMSLMNTRCYWQRFLTNKLLHFKDNRKLIRIATMAVTFPIS